MRKLRSQLLGDSGRTNYYHVVSRVVNRDLVLGDKEKEYFRQLLVKQLKFSGLKALAWCCMGNHFHLLLEVPDKEASLAGWTEDDLLKRLKVLADESHTWSLLQDVAMWKKNGNRDALKEVAESVRARLCDLSMFMKELKQKFTLWFNKRHVRKGTLWEERFKSTLLEGPDISRLENNAVKFVSAYIDLNAVRAGIVMDPKDYRWCSYAAAVAGDREAKRGIAQVFGSSRSARWSTAAARYRKFLFAAGVEHGQGRTPSGAYKPARHGFTREEADKVFQAKGKLSLGEALYCQVRYVSDGVALGSREFLEDFFENRRAMFGPARKTGARKMMGANWDGLMSIRDLAKDGIQGSPTPPS